MANITNEEYLKKVDNTFVLSILAAERLKELRRGAKPLVKTESTDPAAIVFEEILSGRLTYKGKNEKK